MAKKKLPVPPGYSIGEDTAGWFAERADRTAQRNGLKSRYDAIHWCLVDALRQAETKPERMRRSDPGAAMNLRSFFGGDE